MRFTQDFVYHTNAIAGSTVAQEDVPKILKAKTVHNSDELETKGVANAIEFIRNTKQKLSLSLLLTLHKLCFEHSKSFAGKLRSVEVVIRSSAGDIIHRGIPAKHVEEALEEMFTWDEKNHGKFKPLVLAAILHNQFEYIHPFQDGNGRVGRLLLNYVLVQHNYPPINITLEDRKEYYKALQEYDAVHDVKPMLQLLVKQYRKGLKRVTTKKKSV